MLIRKIQKNKKKSKFTKKEVEGPILRPKQHFAYK
jgi:hypothetical protein